MPTRPRRNYDKKTLVRLLDYCRYLYEEEKQRNEKLSSATNTYLVVITFAFTFSVGLLGWLFPDVTSLPAGPNSKVQLILWFGLGVSILILLLSLVFTILVVKVRQFERLCDPKDFAAQATSMHSEDELMSSMIANYVVATERNFETNNAKAGFLAAGLQAYLVGFVLLLATLVGVYIAGR